jgi:hypothetical protein
MEKIIVGDILVYSWGYEQTNIDCYQVIKRTEKMVYINKIGTEVVRSINDMIRCVEPKKDDFVGEVIRKKIKFNGSYEYVNMDFGIADKWNNKELRETSYY